MSDSKVTVPVEETKPDPWYTPGDRFLSECRDEAYKDEGSMQTMHENLTGDSGILRNVSEELESLSELLGALTPAVEPHSFKMRLAMTALDRYALCALVEVMRNTIDSSVRQLHAAMHFEYAEHSALVDGYNAKVRAEEAASAESARTDETPAPSSAVRSTKKGARGAA